MSSSQQINLIRQERHAHWKKQQLCHKWAPIFVELMNRKKYAATRIQHWLKQVLYKNADEKEWSCNPDTPGIYRIRFSLTSDQICLRSMGVTMEEWKNMGVIIAPFAIVEDVRTLRSDGLISARCLMYRLSKNQLMKLVRAQKLTSNIRYIQDIEYSRSIAADIKEGRLSQKN